MAVLPGAGGVGGSSTGKSGMRGRHDDDRDGVVEKRVVAKSDADFHSGELVESFVEHQHIVFTAPRKFEGLLSRAGASDLVTSFQKHAFKRATQPLVATSDQGHHRPRVESGHETV